MFQAILNVLAIIVLAVAAGFIILLLIDLILGCIDGKRGVIFFKNRKNTNKDNEILLQYNKDLDLNDSYYIQNNNQDLVLDFDKEFEKANEPVQNTNIDLAKAEEEQKLLEAKNADITEETEIQPEVEQIEESETEVNEEFTFINKISPELEKELEEEQRKAENPEEEEEDEFPGFSDDDEDDEDDDDKSIEEILNAIRERNKMARNKFLAEEDLEDEFDDEDDEESFEEEIADAEEVVENTENKEAVSAEIEKLNEIIKELNAKIEAEQAKNAEIEEKAKLDLENLKKEYEEKADEEIPSESLEVLEAKLVTLEERQKQNDKDLKANRKEFIPLARIEKTLENDQNKLRRREAIVAKKKIVLFGVNNYVVDEEKEKKLKEDLDLLEGLRMSVNHCEEVMNANKDRYPVLKRTNEILTRNAEQIENDIKEVEAKIAKIKEAQTDATGDMNSNVTGDDSTEN